MHGHSSHSHPHPHSTRALGPVCTYPAPVEDGGRLQNPPSHICHLIFHHDSKFTNIWVCIETCTSHLEERKRGRQVSGGHLCSKSRHVCVLGMGIDLVEVSKKSQLSGGQNSEKFQNGPGPARFQLKTAKTQTVLKICIGKQGLSVCFRTKYCKFVVTLLDVFPQADTYHLHTQVYFSKIGVFSIR